MTGNDDDPLIDANVWQSFAATMRGNPPSNEFIGSPAGDGVYTYDTGFTPNAGAVFADFVSDPTIANLRKLGDGDVRGGLENLREFTGNSYPNFILAMNSLATNNIRGSDNSALGAEEPGPITRGSAADIARILGNRGDLVDFVAALGIPADTIDADAFANDMHNIFDPGYINSDYIREQYAKVKPSFGICPHIAIKFGHYIPKIHSAIYAKVGFMQLNAKFVSQLESVETELGKFRKITPFFAVGVSKNLSRNFGLALEFSHACKTRKTLRQGKAYDNDYVLNVDLSRSSIKLIGFADFSLDTCFK
jgi:hypothetical protein